MAQNYDLGFRRPHGMRMLSQDDVVQPGDWIYRPGAGWGEVFPGTVFVGARVGQAGAARPDDQALAEDWNAMAATFGGSVKIAFEKRVAERGYPPLRQRRR